MVKTCNFGDAANIGAQVTSKVKSFDVEAPELEAHLAEYETAKESGKSVWFNREVVGVEIIKPLYVNAIAMDKGKST